jgi:Uma2 family endonuclease
MAVDMPSSATKLTYEDLLQLPDDGKRHELLAGEHHVSPSPSLRHQVISLNLAVALRAFVRQRGLGLVLAAPFDVVFTSHDVVAPDLLYVSAGRRAILSDANVAGAPDLVVEILSSWSRRRDEVLKRDLYDRAGVGEYWLVDPEAESVKVLRRAGAATPFARPLLLTRRDGDILTTPLLPELELSLEDVFAE